MRYEIYVPRQGKKESWIRLLVEGSSWSNALKSGLLKLGEDGALVDEAVCDVRPNGVIFVRDAKQRRTFLLRTLAPSEGAPAQQAPTRTEPPRPRPLEGLSEAANEELSLHAAVPGETPPARVIEERIASRLPTDAGGVGHATTTPTPDVLEARMQQLGRELEVLVAFGRDLRSAANRALDLAMHWVPSESGAALFTHSNARDLYFAAARGPKAEEVFQFRIPMGVGVAGFAAAEGTCLAVNDVARDPRFYRRISESIGHNVSNLMAVPILAQGRVFGALELLNRNGGAFGSSDLRLLSLIGLRLGEHLHTVLLG